MNDTRTIDWQSIEGRLKHFRHLFMKNGSFHLFNLEKLQARFDEGKRIKEHA